MFPLGASCQLAITGPHYATLLCFSDADLICRAPEFLLVVNQRISCIPFSGIGALERQYD
jgi:hypothetical protein